MRFRRFAAAAFAIAQIGAIQAVFGPGAADARPLTPAENRYARWQGRVPLCGDPEVMGVIQGRFGEREGVYWGSNLNIAGFDYIRETGLRSPGVDYIPRRYCSAKAMMSDHSVRQIYYWIGEDLGMTGTDALGNIAQSLTLGLLTSRSWISTATNWGVDWCVVGLDRNYAYGLNCKAARP